MNGSPFAGRPTCRANRPPVLAIPEARSTPWRGALGPLAALLLVLGGCTSDGVETTTTETTATGAAETSTTSTTLVPGEPRWEVDPRLLDQGISPHDVPPEGSDAIRIGLVFTEPMGAADAFDLASSFQTIPVGGYFDRSVCIRGGPEDMAIHFALFDGAAAAEETRRSYEEQSPPVTSFAAFIDPMLAVWPLATEAMHSEEVQVVAVRVLGSASRMTDLETDPWVAVVRRNSPYFVDLPRYDELVCDD